MTSRSSGSEKRPRASDLGPQACLDKATRLLAARARTEKELDAALTRAGFSSEDRHSALARVRDLGYLDDRETARQRARSRVELGDAPRLAERKLEAQGVDAAVARAAVAEAANEKSADELAARALQRKLRGRKPADEREKRRLLRWLIAKGHRAAAAAKALGIEWEGDDELEV